MKKLKAKWIWNRQADYNIYNQTVIARKNFKLGKFSGGTISITADSFYRLYINGQWVNDGPCRAWPEHYQYDQIEVGNYLQPGENQIKVIARYYGVGDFHRVPQQAGLLVQLDVNGPGGRTKTIISDGTWQVALAKAWVSNTPKICLQTEPLELYDGRLEESLKFRPAAVCFDTHEGPWKELNPRDVALMTKIPFACKSFIGANLVTCQEKDYCIPVRRLVFPGLIEANMNTGAACGIATIIKLSRKTTVKLCCEGLKIAIDGKSSSSGSYRLSAGRHMLVAFNVLSDITYHERTISLANVGEFTLENPVKSTHENPWCFIKLAEFAYARNDMLFYPYIKEDPKIGPLIDEYNKLTQRWLKQVKDKKSLTEQLGERLRCYSSDKMFVHNSYWPFKQRKVVGKADKLVVNPAALMHDNGQATEVHPSKNGDIELAYDLGEQNCGYYSLDLYTEQEGLQVDINGIEYITPQGRLQHPMFNRNGVRYITKKGYNKFVSLMRRSGRYIFIILRNQTKPVFIKKFQLIESTYPVNQAGSFSCSDIRLDKIWEISTRTLKLCMEDSLTDCPLYEKTLWVGDARNESLFAYTVFGAPDLARRCISIAAQSLERYPMVGAQVPSSWDMLIPAWGFLWGISVWEYYWYSGDEKFLHKIWPAVVKNIKGAAKDINSDGLFSGPYWNFFDWSNIDERKTVLHNSMILVGAINAAINCGQVLGDKKRITWLKELRQKLCKAINRLWDDKKKAYPDSIHDDGTISKSTCQHTSFLAVLYDIINRKNIGHAVKNILNPPAKMIKVGAPFSVMYLLETLEKIGQADEIVKLIYQNYLPMLQAGATTVWETFPTGNLAESGFPTRSHTHAWSSAPVYFLSRVILGIKQTCPAGQKFQISPRLNGLTWAKGACMTINGPLAVSWKVKDKELLVNYSAPEGTQAKFLKNETHKGLKIVVNQEQYSKE